MIDHYREIFDRLQWLENGLCWVVVQPFDEETSRDDLLWRLNGGRDPEHEVVEYPPEAGAMDERPMLLTYQAPGVWGFLEFSWGYALTDRTLARLSEDARVWMVTWHFKGGDTMLYAADGQIRVKMRDFIFAEHLVELGEDRDALRGFRAMLDDMGAEDYTGKRCAAFAYIEGETGVRFDSAPLEAEVASVVILDHREI